MPWRVRQRMPSASSSSSSPSFSGISVCTAGSPQLFMLEHGGWIFKSLLKVEVKQKADWADWVRRAVKWAAPHLNEKNTAGEKQRRVGKKKSDICVCLARNTLRVFASRLPPCYQMFLRAPQDLTLWVTQRSDALSQSRLGLPPHTSGADSAPEMGHTLAKGGWHMADYYRCTVNALRRNYLTVAVRQGAAVIRL